MKYLGGKSKHGEEIARVIRSKKRFGGQTIREPFCGACWVSKWLYLESVICSDNHESLICLHRAIQQGWEPPDFISEGEYIEAHQQWKDGICNPWIGFVGFACSWGAKWWGGYARGHNKGVARNYCLEAKQSLLKNRERLKYIIFEYQNYKNIDPVDTVIYCDPPYRNTVGFHGEIFDTIGFWETMRYWSQNNVVLISEYVAPPDFVTIWQAEHFSMKGTDTKITTEKLFMLEK